MLKKFIVFLHTVTGCNSRKAVTTDDIVEDHGDKE